MVYIFSLTSKVYRVFNRRTLNVEESMHVAFDKIVDLKGVVTRNMLIFCMTVAFVSQIEPKNVEEAL